MKSAGHLSRISIIAAICLLWSFFPTGGVKTAAGANGAEPSPSIEDRVAVFYYPWYGNPATDNRWIHWNGDSETPFYPPSDVSSDYYPVLGAYSAKDPQVVEKHFQWLNSAKVGVIIASWWGQGKFEDKTVPVLLQVAEQYGIKVAFHIEPYEGRTADRLEQDIRYIYKNYGSHPAFYRTDRSSRWSPDDKDKGLFFVWSVTQRGIQDDAGEQVDASYWKNAMDAVHGLPDGGIVIANTTDADWIDEGHFDGLYNYATLQTDIGGGFDWAQAIPEGAWYCPSVIPGFSARRIGYSEDTYVPRQGGATYDEQWREALSTGVEPQMVTITSFNEWHEGTQIEPAAQGADNGRGHVYEDFTPLSPEGYLQKTKAWADNLADWDWPILCPGRIRIRTTSDWTTLELTKGGGLLRPSRLSASSEATEARMTDGAFVLSQPLSRAESGGAVEMIWDVTYAMDNPNGVLTFEIGRGHLGITQASILDEQGNAIHNAQWGGIDSINPANTVEFRVPAFLLPCD